MLPGDGSTRLVNKLFLIFCHQVAALPKGGAVEIEAVALVAADIKDEIIEKKCDCTAK